ncbi:hypothetical protein EVG20_g7638 [Dentipellis fragilis]|uniref:O-methyltransferase domain-containing protein n=1 Tax=Dentipellis fragilis TaxID=205917 RepID=A0A4Y9YG06_9AGAM|nr:hypothetical protein EVG20_g7638 [Dentipellis fragilis]
MDMQRTGTFQTGLLATHHIFVEVAPDVFANNRISSFLDSGKSVATLVAHPEQIYDGTSGITALVGHFGDESFKASAYLPDVILDPVTSHSYDPKKTAINKAFNSDLDYFSWYETPGNESRVMRFGHAMNGSKAFTSNNAIVGGLDWDSLKEGALVVDVGGGVGSQCLTLAENFSHLQFVIQDRPAITLKVLSRDRTAWASCLQPANEALAYLGLNTSLSPSIPLQPMPLRGPGLPLTPSPSATPPPSTTRSSPSRQEFVVETSYNRNHPNNRKASAPSQNRVRNKVWTECQCKKAEESLVNPVSSMGDLENRLSASVPGHVRINNSDDSLMAFVCTSLPEYLRNCLASSLKQCVGDAAFKDVESRGDCQNFSFSEYHFSWYNRHATKGINAPAGISPVNLSVKGARRTNHSQMLPYLSADMEKHDDVFKDLRDMFQDVIRHVEAKLKECLPEEYKLMMVDAEFLPGNAQLFVRPFLGWVVNINIVAEAHRDGKDRHYCLVMPLGDFEGGALVLYEQGLVLELRNGDYKLYSTILCAADRMQQTVRPVVMRSSRHEEEVMNNKYYSAPRFRVYGATSLSSLLLFSPSLYHPSLQIPSSSLFITCMGGRKKNQSPAAPATAPHTRKAASAPSAATSTPTRSENKSKKACPLPWLEQVFITHLRYQAPAGKKRQNDEDDLNDDNGKDGREKPASKKSKKTPTKKSLRKSQAEAEKEERVLVRATTLQMIEAEGQKQTDDDSHSRDEGSGNDQDDDLDRVPVESHADLDKEEEALLKDLGTQSRKKKGSTNDSDTGLEKDGESDEDVGEGKDVSNGYDNSSTDTDEEDSEDESQGDDDEGRGGAAGARGSAFQGVKLVEYQRDKRKKKKKQYVRSPIRASATVETGCGLM